MKRGVTSTLAEAGDAHPGTRPRASNAEQLVSRTSGAVSTLLGWILVFAVAVNFANVFARYVLDNAMLGAEEVQVFSMVWLTFLGAAVMAWRDEHLRMDVLALRLPRRVRLMLVHLETVLLAALSLFMLYQSGAFTLQMFQLGRNSDAMQVPMAIPHSALVVGFALLSCLAVLRLLGIRRAADPDTTEST